MATYGIPAYKAGKYGNQPLIAFSTEPVTAVALDYNRVVVSWNKPQGNFTQIALLRSQVGYPENVTDGVLLWNEITSSGVTRSSFIDGFENFVDEDPSNDIALVQGEAVFYRMFLRLQSGLWIPAGETFTTLPKDYGSHTQLLNLLPQIYTNEAQSPLTPAEDNTTLSTFLRAFTLTYDLYKTDAELLIPDYQRSTTPLSLIDPMFWGLGLPFEPGLPIRNRRRMLREAVYVYQRKGTANALSTIAEAITGWNPTITQSPNLMLNISDSSFEGNSIGGWEVPATGGTFDAVNTILSPEAEDAIQRQYVGEAVVTNDQPFTITLGIENPIEQGIPLEANQNYTFSFYAKTADLFDVTVTVHWFDRKGVELDTSETTYTDFSSEWKRKFFNVTPAADAYYAGLSFTFQTPEITGGTCYIDLLQFAKEHPQEVSFFDARSVDIFFDPDLVNYLKNPSFEQGVQFWTANNVQTITSHTTSVPIPFAGTKVAKVTAAGNWSLTSDNEGVGPVRFYTGSVYMKTDGDIENVTISVEALNGASVVRTVSKNYEINGGWKRLDVTMFFPEGTYTSPAIRLRVSGSAGTFYIDSALLEQSFKVSEYFDGGLPEAYGAVWSGLPHQSISYLYTDRQIKQARVTANLRNYVPKYVPFRIRTYAGSQSFSAE